MLPDEMVLASCENESAAPPLDARHEVVVSERELPFDQVFESFHPMVFNLACRILGDREEALDVTQEVFLAVYRKLPGFRRESSLKTWVYKIAVNRAANRRRWWNRLRRRGTVSLEGHLAGNAGRSIADRIVAPGRSPEENVLARARRVEIEEALYQLPMPQRVAVVMRDVEGLSYEEISAALQVTLGTVKSRIARGREELKRRLNGALG